MGSAERTSADDDASDALLSPLRALAAMAAMVSLYFFSFFLRTAVPGTIFDELQSDLDLSAASVAALGSIFLYIYAGMQLFVGLAADRFESEVERLVGSIAANPSLFPPYDDEHRFARLRRFPYCLVYQAVPDGVQVVALAHVRRRPGYWRGRG